MTGSAVAVERGFSGGRDTIGIRRARLKAETIRTLMLVKACVKLDRQRAVVQAQRALKRAKTDFIDLAGSDSDRTYYSAIFNLFFSIPRTYCVYLQSNSDSCFLYVCNRVPSHRPPSDGRPVHRPVPSNVISVPLLPYRLRTVHWTAVFGTVRPPGQTVTIPIFAVANPKPAIFTTSSVPHEFCT
jgi:hypothetical protein